MDHSRRRIVSRLTAFCHNELAAAEGCRVAGSCESDRAVRRELHHCGASHEARALLLGRRIVQLGGATPDSGRLRRALEHSVKETLEPLSGRTTLALLEAHEDERLEDYRHEMEDLDDETRQFIVEDILPEQELTQSRISALTYAFF
jgi:hypothetical protein